MCIFICNSAKISKIFYYCDNWGALRNNSCITIKVRTKTEIELKRGDIVLLTNSGADNQYAKVIKSGKRKHILERFPDDSNLQYHKYILRIGSSQEQLKT